MEQMPGPDSREIPYGLVGNLDERSLEVLALNVQVASGYLDCIARAAIPLPARIAFDVAPVVAHCSWEAMPFGWQSSRDWLVFEKGFCACACV